MKDLQKNEGYTEEMLRNVCLGASYFLTVPAWAQEESGHQSSTGYGLQTLPCWDQRWLFDLPRFTAPFARLSLMPCHIPQSRCGHALPHNTRTWPEGERAESALLVCCCLHSNTGEGLPASHSYHHIFVLSSELPAHGLTSSRASQMARVMAEEGTWQPMGRQTARTSVSTARQAAQTQAALCGGLCWPQGARTARTEVGYTAWQEWLPPAGSILILGGESKLILLEWIQAS